MYDMYPDDWHHDSWGPAKHRADHPRSAENVRRELQAAFDRRDARDQRPDDN